MHLIQVHTAHPQDFEAFPEDCDRSVVGALRLAPGATLEITAGELAAMQAAGIQLRVLRSPADPQQALPLLADQDESPALPASTARPRRPRVKKGLDEIQT